MRKRKLIEVRFIKYYDDCYALFARLEEQAIEGFVQMLSVLEENQLQNTLVAMLNVLQEHQMHFKVFVENQPDSTFVHRLFNCALTYIQVQANSKLPPTISEKDKTYCYTYLCGGCSSVIEYWMRTDMQETPQVIAHRLETFSTLVINTLL